MTALLCATTNAQKFQLGRQAFAKFQLQLEQVSLDIDEIQGEQPEPIIQDKARRAFEQIGKPLVVTDDCWDVPELGGFPGPYMKSMNHWLGTDDFLRLFAQLKDRTIYINQLVAYIDERETVVFRQDVRCKLLLEARGDFGAPIQKIAALEGTDRSFSERWDSGDTADATGTDDAWHQLAKWYAAKQAV